ncbi:hypothetical protein J1614_005059 [Plenodomus biglobosus]|nr:hypothetical protein J1614_005059 [Plenodomus biglobosus]
MLTESGGEIVTNDAKSEESTIALVDPCDQTFQTKAKDLWKKLKEEIAERKTTIQYVTSAEATAITGHGENGPKSNAKGRKGDKRIASALALF